MKLSKTALATIQDQFLSFGQELLKLNLKHVSTDEWKDRVFELSVYAAENCEKVVSDELENDGWVEGRLYE